MTAFLAYALVGKIGIWFLQQFPISSLPIIGKFFRDGKLAEWYKCDLCLGTWVYWALAFVFQIVFFREFFYLIILSELVTGAFTSLIVHLISIGWNEKFGTIVLE